MRASGVILKMLAAPAIMALAIGVAAQTPGAKKTLTGMVSDSMCGAAHMMQGMNDAQCTRACVKMGGDYILVVGKTSYTLQGHADEVDKLAGAKATVSGTVSGTTMTVQSVAAAK